MLKRLLASPRKSHAESCGKYVKTTGLFGYFCTLHPWMNGFVTVGDVEFIETSMNVDFKTRPIVLDTDFKIEEFVSGLFVPVNMEFVENNCKCNYCLRESVLF